MKPYEKILAPPGIDPVWWQQNEEFNAMLVDNTILRAKVTRLQNMLNHPAIEFVRQAHAEGRIITKLIPPSETHDGPRYAGFYCQDYVSPPLPGLTDDES